MASYSEPEYAKPLKEGTHPFYIKNIDKYLTPENCELLVSHNDLPNDQLSKHVHGIRDKLWAIRTYPCIGLGVWLVPYITVSPAYSQMLERLKAGQVFLDIGVFIGADMRRLVLDGAPSDNMYGVDIVNHWDLGYELYKDKDKFAAHFIEADALSRDQPELVALHHKVDIISVSAVLHQWSLHDQLVAAKRIIEFSKPGSIIVGYQIGASEAVDYNALTGGQWDHNPESFIKLWDEAGAATGTKWQTEARLLSWEELGWDAKDMGWLGKRTPIDFVVTRLS